jgi:hypothetical protein
VALKPFKPGESGNPAGRPVGTRVRFSEEFLQDFHEAWQKHGKEALERVAKRHPIAFLRAAVAVLPKQLNVKRDSDLPEEKRKELIAEIIARIGEGAYLSNGLTKAKTNGH